MFKNGTILIVIVVAFQVGVGIVAYFGVLAEPWRGIIHTRLAANEILWAAVLVVALIMVVFGVATNASERYRRLSYHVVVDACAIYLARAFALSQLDGDTERGLLLIGVAVSAAICERWFRKDILVQRT